MKITPLLFQATVARTAAAEARDRAGVTLDREESRRLLRYASALEQRAADLDTIAGQAIDDLLVGEGMGAAKAGAPRPTVRTA